MKGIFILLFHIAIPIGSIFAQKTYSIDNRIVFKNEDCDLSHVSLILPVPPDDDYYQQIHAIRHSSGKVCKSPNTENYYLRDDRTDNLPSAGNEYTLSENFDVTLFPMLIDMRQFKDIYPYDTTSVIYRMYTGGDGVYIDTAHQRIREISSALWAEANRELLKYAELCYEYVARHFKYHNPYTGLHPLAQLLADGGGDCGNLSSIYVSLLRARNIPSRHIVTVRPDGSYHVWADFYLERYGWIPVDVTRKQAHPEGDYFGYCAGDGIVMSKGICSNIQHTEGANYYKAELLQAYYYWYWSKAGIRTAARHEVYGRPSGTVTNPEVEGVFQNKIVFKWEPPRGATSYIVKLYSAKKTEEPLQVYRFGTENSQWEITGLKSGREYVFRLSVCRRVGNIETIMDSRSVRLRTR